MHYKPQYILFSLILSLFSINIVRQQREFSGESKLEEHICDPSLERTVSSRLGASLCLDLGCSRRHSYTFCNLLYMARRRHSRAILVCRDMLAFRRGLYHIVVFERCEERLCSIYLVTMEVSSQSEFQLQPNKAFKFVPALRASTGRCSATPLN